MKENIHPSYQEVVFEDSSTGQRFICGSTIQSKEKVKIEGKEYPLVKLSTSSYSHPFYTKSDKRVDAAGRIDKFNKRYATPIRAQAAPPATKSVEKKKKK